MYIFIEENFVNKLKQLHINFKWLYEWRFITNSYVCDVMTKQRHVCNFFGVIVHFDQMPIGVWKPID